MKRLLFSVFLVFVTSMSLFAQKVEVKKGQILIDKQMIGSIEQDKATKQFTISSKDGSPIFYANLCKMTDDGYDDGTAWLRVTSIDGTKVGEIKRDKSYTLGQALGGFNSKSAARLLTLDGGIFTSAGIDEKALETLFVEGKKVTRAVHDHFAELNKRKEKEDEISPFIEIEDATGNILFKKQKIGQVRKPASYEYVLVDLAGDVMGRVSVGSIDSEPEKKMLMLATFDQNIVYVLQAEEGNQLSTSPLVRNMVLGLYASGYTFGNYQVDSANRDRGQQLEEARAKTRNIYNKPGTIALARNNERISGAITIEFVPVKDPSDPYKSVDIDKFGSFLMLKNKSGELKYEASEVKSFEVNDNGTFRTFIGFDSGKRSVLAQMFLDAGERFRFLEVVYKDGDSYLLENPGAGVYVIILNGSMEKYVFVREDDKEEKGTAGYEKKVAEVRDFLNCQGLDNESYDIYTKEGLMSLMKAFSDKCR